MDHILQTLSQAPGAANTSYVCLQTCPWQRAIYICAIVPFRDTVAPAPAAGKGAAAAVAPAVSLKRVMDKMVLTEADRRKLQVLLDQQRHWKTDVLKFCAQYCEEIKAGSDLDDAAPTPQLMTVVQKAERALDERLRALLDDLQALMLPLLGPSTPLGTALSAAQVAGQPQQCVLLLDAWLQALPWEGIDLFDNLEAAKSRDFSLHFLHHRLRIPTAGAAAAGAAGASAVIPPAVVNASQMKIISDPWQDDGPQASAGSITAALKDSLVSTPGGAKWTNLRLPERGQLGVDDFLLVFDSSANSANKTAMGLFGLSLGRLGSILLPGELSVANLERLQVLVCMDHAHNDSSFRRQNSIDVLKSANEVFLESPLALSAIASLSGAGCIVSHSWGTPYQAQKRFVGSLLAAWTTKKESISAAVHDGRQVLRDGEKVKVKRWICLARVVIGTPAVNYQDA